MKYAIFSATLVAAVTSSCGSSGRCAEDENCPFGYICGDAAVCVAVAGSTRGGDSESAAAPSTLPPSPQASGCANSSAPQVLFLDGDPECFVHAGQLTVEGGVWEVKPSGDGVNIEGVEVIRRGPDGSYSVSIRTAEFGEVLAERSYPDAREFDLAVPDDSPDLEVNVLGPNFRGCPDPGTTGRFVISDLEIDNETRNLSRLSMTFNQTCEGLPGELRGCLRYEAPPAP